MEDAVDLCARPAIRIILLGLSVSVVQPQDMQAVHKKTDHPNRDSMKPSEGDGNQYGFGKMLKVKIQPEMAF